jgi:hypothetical protein
VSSRQKLSNKEKAFVRLAGQCTRVAKSSRASRDSFKGWSAFHSLADARVSGQPLSDSDDSREVERTAILSAFEDRGWVVGGLEARLQSLVCRAPRCFTRWRGSGSAGQSRVRRPCDRRPGALAESMATRTASSTRRTSDSRRLTLSRSQARQKELSETHAFANLYSPELGFRAFQIYHHDGDVVFLALPPSIA